MIPVKLSDCTKELDPQGSVLTKSLSAMIFHIFSKDISYLISGKSSKMCTPCQLMDARELSWPMESRTISLTTFAKDRWQTKNTSTGKFEQFKTIRYMDGLEFVLTTVLFTNQQVVYNGVRGDKEG